MKHRIYTRRYQVLLSCLNKSSDKIVLAGDPLQTINPTGFDWDRIKAMMYEKFKESQMTLRYFHTTGTPKDIVGIKWNLGIKSESFARRKVNFQISNEIGQSLYNLYF